MARGSREANVEIGARSRKLNAGLRRARGKLQRFGKKSSRDLKKSFAGVGKGLAAISGLGGAAGIAVAARDVAAFETKLIRLRIQSGISEEQTSDLRRQIRGMSDDTGIASDKLLDGTAQFVSLTGRMDQAQSSMKTFAKVAVASGAEMSDITATAAALSQSLDIDPTQMEQAFSTLLFQGKQGAIELRELSSLMATVGSQFPDFGKVGVEGVAELGASLQIIRQGFGSGSEAVTGMMGMMTAFGKKSKEFGKFGVRIFDKDDSGVKTFRSFSDIVTDIGKSKLMKDPAALMKVFGRAEGKRAFDMLAKNVDEFERLKNAGMTAKDVQQDYMLFQQSSAGKMARSWEKIKNTIARVFTPARIENFARAMEKVAELVGFMAENIKLTVALLAAAKLSPALAGILGGGIEGYLAGGGKGGGKGAKGGSGGFRGNMVAAAAGAAALGFAAGTAADQLLGLSDKIAGVGGGNTKRITEKQLAPLRTVLEKETDPLKLQRAARQARHVRQQGTVEDVYGQRRAVGLQKQLRRKAEDQLFPEITDAAPASDPIFAKAVAKADDEAKAAAAEKKNREWAARMEKRKAAATGDEELRIEVRRQQRLQLDVNVNVDSNSLVQAQAKEARQGGE